MHTLAETIAALLEARAEGRLTVTVARVQTPDGLHRLHQHDSTWYAVARGHGTRVPTWLAQLLYPLLLSGRAPYEGETR